MNVVWWQSNDSESRIELQMEGDQCYARKGWSMVQCSVKPTRSRYVTILRTTLRSMLHLSIMPRSIIMLH